MLKVGLTGGIASGKTAVGEMFAELGAYVVQADEIAHGLMLPGGSVYGEVVRHFGSTILNPDRTVNRSRLAELVFAPHGKPGQRITELNQIVHPAVIRKQEEWMDEIATNHPDAVAIVEAALILEAGAGKSFDRLIVVTCRPEQRFERWAIRTKTDIEAARREVEQRMSAQFPDEVKIKAANYVIDNSGSLEETRKQVEDVFRSVANDQRPAAND